jgi:hypothetical protein
MKRRYLASVAGIFVLSTVTPGAAADLNPMYKSPTIAPVYNWSGFNVGLDGGSASSHECLTIINVAGAAVFPNSEGLEQRPLVREGRRCGHRQQIQLLLHCHRCRVESGHRNPLGRWHGDRFEFGFGPNWSVAVEYDHLFMGSNSVTFQQSAIAVGRSDNIGQDVDMGTMRVNYHF